MNIMKILGDEKQIRRVMKSNPKSIIIIYKKCKRLNKSIFVEYIQLFSVVTNITCMNTTFIVAICL